MVDDQTMPFFEGYKQKEKTKYESDRQTDNILTEIKVITDLFVIVIRGIYVHVYKNVSLLKSYMTIYMVWQKTKIMLSGIAIIKTGYFGNINDYF